MIASKVYFFDASCICKGIQWHVAAQDKTEEVKACCLPDVIVGGVAPFPGKAGEWKSVGKVRQEVVCKLDALKQANQNPLQVSKQLP